MSKWTFSKITFIAVSTALSLHLIHGYLSQVPTPKLNLNLNLPSWAMVCFLVVSGLALLLVLGFVGFVMLVSEFNLVSNVTNEYDSFDGLGAGEPYLLPGIMRSLSPTPYGKKPGCSEKSRTDARGAKNKGDASISLLYTQD
ncbi:hypothetical protein [Microseira wollei]|uniref:Uncharacterized protein n=1 Tax=Microseira wollei NIES-4236 TaxID=2530354 RepID=A0AAV3X762_9CYAN|nr:hypothetical protein [Microseira wollei]GET37983.1 hypothetical protein MiSe_27370 [Microseira wollei NIES-4236]